MNRTPGFTIVELLVAIAILGIVLMSIGAILPGVAKLNQNSRQDQTVVLAGRAYFEQVRAELKNNFNSSISGVTVPGNNQNGLSCTTQESERLSTVTAGVKLSRTVTLRCTVSGRATTFTLTIANPDLGKS
ncbi:type II secretion system protein [Deinococcus sedimenti]|uniref:Prepilin-type N-terminal cleavage/methylation domain-containing protein n=1 Tax=Deinococcus sedimenti TaxID=1867090 RepID=A0ABQ2S3R0_9DEIO|nr:type II secretion system protein [Deinococcus sedimenti]GGR91813.1 hypothetical protein GCM10008960_18430 [Deinococcus sedimenti]